MPKRVKPEPPPVARLVRPASLTAQVEQALRRGIAENRFPAGRLPTEEVLAEQFGVSRETVRLATEVLQREGLVVKVRRRGTFVRSGEDQAAIRPAAATTLLGYLQTDYAAAPGGDDPVTRSVGGLMLQGAMEEAGHAGYQLVVVHAPAGQLRDAFERMQRGVSLGGVVFASCGEDKLVKRAVASGLPVVLLDHDLNAPNAHSVREDSAGGARLAVGHLAALGHRSIGFVNWDRPDLNPWRADGYRHGLREAGLPRQRRWEFEVPLTPAGAQRVVAALLALRNRPTALYCFNNTLARLVRDELRAHGLRVPEDVSILGGGGEEVEELTCHQADWAEAGRAAVRILLREVSGSRPSSPEHVLIPHTIRPGRTAAAPKPG